MPSHAPAPADTPLTGRAAPPAAAQSGATTLAAPVGVVFAAVLLGAATVLAPLALGATPPIVRATLEAAVALAVVAWALWGRPAQPALALAPVALAAALALAVVPLPTPLLGALAPLPADLWRRGDDGGAWRTISVDPAATAAGLRRLLLGLATLVVVADLGRWAALRRALAGCLAFSGAVILLLGLAVRPAAADRLILGFVDLSGPIVFWKTPVHEPVETAGCSEPEWVTVAGERYQADGWIVGDRIGSYVVSNHFAGGLELTLPFAVALVALAWRMPRLPAAALATALSATGLYAAWVVAGSRAGGACLALGLSVLLARIAPRGWRRRTAAAVAAAAAVTLATFQVLFVTRSDWVVAWLPLAWQRHALSMFRDYRLYLGARAFRLFRESPLAGTGLGTFGDTEHRVTGGGTSTFYAHNDWAQWCAETGLLGVVAGIALVCVILRARRRRDARAAPVTPAVDAAAWSAVAAIAAHSLYDWNLHVPANALLAAVAGGLAVSAGEGESPAGPVVAPPSPAVRLGRAGPALLAAACLVAWALLARDAWADGERRRLRDALATARLAAADPGRDAPEAVLRAALARGSAAARLDPADSRFEVLLGQLGLHLAAGAGDPAAARLERERAEGHFARARRLSAVCRGLPEIAPPPRPRRPPKP
ncbi:MAG: O-antigen ligase family protein [Planctomycetaceae bacterium]